MRRREPWMLGLAVLLAYLNGFWGAFQFDDFKVIVGNPAVHAWAAWAGDAGGIRPLLKASYALNWSLGQGVLGFHLFNLGVHLANVLMAWRLLQRLLAREEGRAPELAFWAALLFALHPLQTEAVTYISGRSVSMAAFFSLASLLAYAEGQGSRLRRQALSPGLFLLACLTRETALVLPLVLSLWEYTEPGGRGRPLRGPWVHWALLGLLGAGLCWHGGYRHLLEVSFGSRAAGPHILSQIAALGYLLQHWAWPVSLNIDPRLAVPTGWSWGLALQAVLLAGLGVLGFASRRTRPWLSFGLLWFFILLLPTNSVIPRLDVVNERQAYLPALGLDLALAGLAFEVMEGRRGRAWIRPLGGALALVLLGLTVVRNLDYRSEVRLWQSSLDANPMNPRAHNNLGCAHAYEGRPGQARRAFEAALHLDPGYERARINLARMGR